MPKCQAPIPIPNCLFRTIPAGTCDFPRPTTSLSSLVSHERNIRKSLVLPCQGNGVEAVVHALDCLWQVSLFQHLYQRLLIDFNILSPPINISWQDYAVYYTACPSWAAHPVKIIVAVREKPRLCLIYGWDLSPHTTSICTSSELALSKRPVDECHDVLGATARQISPNTLTRMGSSGITRLIRRKST